MQYTRGINAIWYGRDYTCLTNWFNRYDTDTGWPKQILKYIRYKKSMPVINKRMKKSDLLFWKYLTGTLDDWIFELKPCGKCDINKYIYGLWCTIICHVDTLKIPHVEFKVVDRIINMLNEKYWMEAPLTITQDKVHEYLGTTIYLLSEGNIIIWMDKYAKKR